MIFLLYFFMMGEKRPMILASSFNRNEQNDTKNKPIISPFLQRCGLKHKNFVLRINCKERVKTLNPYEN